MIVCVTGHRPQGLPKDVSGAPTLESAVRTAARWLLTEHKATWLLSGMALGVDQWVAEEALTVPGVQVCAAIPCLQQERFWSRDAQAKYIDLLSRVHAKHFVTTEPYRKHVMQLRNQWMVDQAALVFAVFGGTPGGTANCVKYAIAARKPILRFDPTTRSGEWIR